MKNARNNSPKKVAENIFAGLTDSKTPIYTPAHEGGDAAAIKIQYYGYMAWLIAKLLKNIQYPTVATKVEIQSVGTISTFEDVGTYMFHVLINELQNTLVTIRGGFGDFDMDDFKRLDTLHRSSDEYYNIKNIMSGGLQQEVTAGIYAAVFHLTFLLKAMNDSSTIDNPSRSQLNNSAAPLERLCTIHNSKFDDVQTALIQVSPEVMFDTYGSGSSKRIDFSKAVKRMITKVSKIDNQTLPIIGCPVTFDKEQVTRLWQWGVNIALTAGLITPSNNHTEH